MKVCFPVIANQGLQSTIYGHFASAPLFLEVDADTGEVSSIPNCDRSDPDAGSNPFKALLGRQLDGVIVSGVGDGMLQILNMMGFRVFEAETESLQMNVELFKKNELPEVVVQNSEGAGNCADVEVGHQCSHTHDGEHNCGHTH
ncbi:MAG: NifB/NifX family molybdenum-iron cluster-binding protein [Geobacteraceae bacterium]